jgi:hypothetical protein
MSVLATFYWELLLGGGFLAIPRPALEPEVSVELPSFELFG